MRGRVGPTDPRFFDNPTGGPVLDHFALPPETYESVFDFGCGCGRQARLMLQQTPRPRRYVGIDVSQEMVRWCQENLSPIDPGFRFFHHDVYSPSYAPENSVRLAAPFPIEDKAFTLVLAHSVFTHLYQSQTDYYLHEVARILRPGGLAFTTWFFFDRASFPFLAQDRACLFGDETAPSEAVLYDRGWFIETIRAAGLRVWRTELPPIAGYQWTVFLTPRSRDSVDEFPLGASGADWLCGATEKSMASPRASLEDVAGKNRDCARVAAARWPEPPALTGALAELALLRAGARGRLLELARWAARRLRR